MNSRKQIINECLRNYAQNETGRFLKDSSIKDMFLDMHGLIFYLSISPLAESTRYLWFLDKLMPNDRKTHVSNPSKWKSWKSSKSSMTFHQTEVCRLQLNVTFNIETSQFFFRNFAKGWHQQAYVKEVGADQCENVDRLHCNFTCCKASASWRWLLCEVQRKIQHLLSIRWTGIVCESEFRAEHFACSICFYRKVAVSKRFVDDLLARVDSRFDGFDTSVLRWFGMSLF